MAIFASSDFNGTSGQSIASFDANWLGYSGDNQGFISNQGRLRPQGDRSLNRNRYNATPPSADYRVDCDVFIKTIGPTTNPNFAGPAVRVDITTANAYFLELVGSPNILRIRRQVGGVYTILASTTQTISAATNYNLSLRISGNTITGYVNDVLKLTTTDSSVTDAGLAGLIQQSNTPDDNNGYHIDNWVVQSVASEYIITPTGGITFSGTGNQLDFKNQNHVIPTAGKITFSGLGNQANTSVPPYIINPSGGIVFSGTGNILNEKSPPHVIPTSGGITFGGSAPMLFNYETPIGGPRMPLTGVGL